MIGRSSQGEAGSPAAGDVSAIPDAPLKALDSRIGEGVRGASLLPVGSGRLEASLGAAASLGGPASAVGHVELGFRPKEGVDLFAFTDARVLFGTPTTKAEVAAGVGARITF